MTSRELPPAEWARLQTMDLAQAVPHLPIGSRVAVVEEGDQILGCWALLPLWHVEGVWIDPAHRGKASVARQLWRRMRGLSRDVGASAVLTGAADPLVATLLERHGAQPMPASYLLTWESD